MPEPNWSEALPADVLRSIFSFCLDDRPSWSVLPLRNGSTDPRIIFLHVCSFWRAVALGAAELWSSVIINLDSMPSDIPISHEVLSRTNGALLKVIVRMSRFQNQAPLQPSVGEFLDKIVVPFAQSLKALELFVPFPFVKSIITLLHTGNIQFPALEALSLRQASAGAIVSHTFGGAVTGVANPRDRLPCLKTVEFDVRCSISLLADWASFPALTVPWSQLTTFVFLQTMPVRTFGDILSLCPGLKSCGVRLGRLGDPPSWFPQLLLPHLERLHLRFSRLAEFDLFLKTCLQLPSIRDLALKESDAGVAWTPILSDFLIDQCGSSLESLFVSSTNRHHPIDANTVGFERFVQKHASTLRELYIPTFCWSHPINVDILRQLISRELCPHLEKLSLDVSYWPAAGQDRLKMIVDAIKEAEHMKRGTLNKLYMFFHHWRQTSKMEPLILDSIKEVSYIPTKIYFRIFHSMIIASTELVTLERNWFGYCV